MTRGHRDSRGAGSGIGFLALTALSLLLTAGSSVAQQARAAPLTKEAVAAWLSREYGGAWEAEVWGKTVWAKGTIAETASIGSPAEALAHANRFIRRSAPLFGLGAEDLRVAGQGEADCQYGVTCRQVSGGVPVDGARLDLTFFKATGGQFSFTGTLVPGISVAGGPKVAPEEAARAADADYRESWRRFTTTYTQYDQIPARWKVPSKPELVIVPATGPEGHRLAWKLACGEATYRIDAMNGGIIDASATPRE